MSTIILAQVKKFQNRFWTKSAISGYIALHSSFGRKKKIGSQISQISDRTLFFDFKNAWKILAFRSAEARSAEASKDENIIFRTRLRLLNEIRTFFDENPDSDF